MTKKIFKSILLILLLSMLACIVIITGVLYEHFAAIQKDQLKTELALATTAVEQGGTDYLKEVNTNGHRFTLIDGTGNVLFDSKADPGTMEDHSDREEFKEAIETGKGESERYSATLTEKTMYYAARLSDGEVLRISIDSMTILSLVLGMLTPICVVVLIVLVLAALLARKMSKQIVQPLNRLDLDHPLETEAYDELSPLLRRINQLHVQVNDQMHELKRKKDEFDQITGSMNEGLVLMDDRRSIISINNAAMELFHTDKSCIGKGFYIIERNRVITEAIDTALVEGHGEIEIERNGRQYQLEISPIRSDDAIVGIVILSFDITEKVFAERNRREFTANVSHELKTPLQTIMGSTELIENGLVKPEDMKTFVGRIRMEAGRLVALIEDIIRLSQLDEKNEMPVEDVDLYHIAEEVKSELQYAAGTKNVTLNLTGEKTVIKGVPKLLNEIMFNLCDNAIKYNREGGSVDVSVTSDKENAKVTVKDTGIGIPEEHINRIFERFYRVDKSHSKESGGTGLGLSIVKHAVQFHHGTVVLDSKEGEGSCFTITFPFREM